MNAENTLVTIFVVTYNSGKYILEALDSAKAQDYKDIELIISDDCSTDNTIELCKDWLAVNKDRFERTELLTTSKNTGVSANGNRALQMARGEWLKCLAGDDILKDDCISSYMKFISSSNCHFVFGLPSVLVDQQDSDIKQQLESYYQNSKPFFNLSAADQFRYLLINGIPISPPTLFCHRKALLELNGFDERYACEDLPLYLQATYSGFGLELLDKPTVNYRIHSQQLSYTNKEELLNERWFFEQLKIKGAYFTLKYIASNPLLSFAYLVQIVPKYLRLKTGNGKKTSGLFNFFASLKSRLTFSYIDKVR